MKKFSINGVELESIEKVVANGRKLAEYRATIAAEAIRKAIAGSRTAPRPLAR